MVIQELKNNNGFRINGIYWAKDLGKYLDRKQKEEKRSITG